MIAMLSLLLSAAPCAAPPPGKWPSLALRPGEVQPLVARPAAGPLGVGQAGGEAPPAAPVALADATARAGSLERDTAAYEKRLRAQLTATTAAGGQAAADAATAQLELTRLDRLGSQAGDLRDRYDALAGDLARAAAAGGDVTALLIRVGKGIDTVEGLRADQARAYAATRGAVPVPTPRP